MMLLVAPPFMKPNVLPPEFVAAETSRGATGASTSLLTNKPVGTVEDDLMLAWLGNSSGQTITSAPSGWALILGPSATVPFYLYAKKAGGSEPSNYSWTWSSSTGNKRTTIVTYRGGYGEIDVAGASFGSGSTATATAPSITATVNGTMLAFFGAIFTTTTNITTPPSGLTERSASFGSSSASPGTAIYDLTPSPAGATGSYALVMSTAQNNRSLLVQIK